MNAEEIEPTNIAEKNALGIEYNAACAIGTRLKDAREENEVTKEFVAKKAKIRERYIDAIELGDWDILPPGLNGRGLVRLYAKELGIALPEFEGFSNLQTIQAEKQSETLSHSNASKKSRYQPAAEESAEIIKIVPRSEYKSVSGETSFSNNYYNTRDSSSTGYQNKFNQTKTHHAAAIVTPKISDIIGIGLNMMPDVDTFNNSNSEKNSITEKNSDNLTLNVLPLAKPVHKQKKLELAPITSQEKNEPTKEIQFQPYLKEESSKSPTDEIKKIDKLALYKQILLKKNSLYFLISSCVLILVYCLYHFNSHEHKLNSQPLLNSERTLSELKDKNNHINSTAQKGLAKTTAPQILIERTAKVDILARVKIQVEADGKEVFSGYHQPGPLEFKFKDKAEILVYDASKVKLTYGTWDHGELGWNERKRKITLNAKPYDSGISQN